MIRIAKPLAAGLLFALALLALVACTTKDTSTSDTPGPVAHVDKMTIAVAFVDVEGTGYETTVDLKALHSEIFPEEQQRAFGYLYQQVYEDGANSAIATDNYVYLEDVIAKAAQNEGLVQDDVWYESCKLECTVGTGAEGDYQEYTWSDLTGYQGELSYEKLSGESRYFYEGVLTYDSLFEGLPVAVPTVIALTIATEDAAIPEGYTSEEYLAALLETEEYDLRSNERTPCLLWGLSAEEDYDIIEQRFPTNIVRIRIIPPQ